MKINIHLIKLILLAFILTLVNCTNQNSIDQSRVHIIPKPNEILIGEQSFTIKSDTKILVDADTKESQQVAEYFAAKINSATGYNLTIKNNTSQNDVDGAILFTLHNADKKLGDEGYELEVNNNSVIIKAPKIAGLFYGVQSLLQLLPLEIVSSDNSNKSIKWSIPAVSLNDKPRYEWRGMLLDPARFFYSKEYLKKYIDLMAMYKLNKLHLHLVDDQGWRVEIKKYPKLTEVGSKRYDLPWDGWQEMSTKGVPFIGGGFYTQEEIKEIVSYAQNRNITIVPEIEMPGHTLSALAAYPEYSCTGGPFNVASGGVDIMTNHTYCIGNEKTYQFLQNVLTEVMELFPGKYIHIGGDETTRLRWETCTKCQARIKKENLDGLDGLYGYFLGRMGKFIESKGKEMIAWDEVLEGGESINGTVMAWRGMDRSLKAIGRGFDVIQTNSSHLYFDDNTNDEGEPRLPLELTYSFEPIPEGVSEEEAKHILGVQGCMWEVPSPEVLEHGTLPRMTALAEIGWTEKESKNLEDFINSLAHHYPRFDAMGYNYRNPDLVGGFNGVNIFTDKIEVRILKPKLQSEVRYTLDGSEPTQESTLYMGPFYLENSAILKACEFYFDGSKSRTRIGTYEKQELLAPVKVDQLQSGLNYQYVEGKYKHTDLVPREHYKKKGILNSFIFPPDYIKHYFGVVYSGIIHVSDDDIYTFYTETNDGSQLYIGNKLVADHPGLHPAEEKGGSIALQSGYHPIKLIYFQNAGASSLKISYESTKIKKQEIPTEVLFH